MSNGVQHELPATSPLVRVTGRRPHRWVAAAAAGIAVATLGAGHADATDSSPRYSKPTISCAGATQTSGKVKVCAGATGTPAGFVVQWLPAEGFTTWSDPDLCKARFSGTAYLGRYNLKPGECVDVDIGELLPSQGAVTNCAAALSCGTGYVLRSQTRGKGTILPSRFTANLYCSTLACGHAASCTFTQGYWKTHGPTPKGNNSNDWPGFVTVSLGNIPYTDAQLLSILNRAPAGNGLITLAHQLIAAKLNVLNGGDGSAIAATIAAADALIGSLVVPPVGTSSLAASATSALTDTLASYNEGAIGPGHCSG